MTTKQKWNKINSIVTVIQLLQTSLSKKLVRSFSCSVFKSNILSSIIVIDCKFYRIGRLIYFGNISPYTRQTFLYGFPIILIRRKRIYLIPTAVTRLNTFGLYDQYKLKVHIPNINYVEHVTAEAEHAFSKALLKNTFSHYLLKIHGLIFCIFSEKIKSRMKNYQVIENELIFKQKHVNLL